MTDIFPCACCDSLLDGSLLPVNDMLQAGQWRRHPSLPLGVRRVPSPMTSPASSPPSTPHRRLSTKTSFNSLVFSAVSDAWSTKADFKLGDDLRKGKQSTEVKVGSPENSEKVKEGVCSEVNERCVDHVPKTTSLDRALSIPLPGIMPSFEGKLLSSSESQVPPSGIQSPFSISHLSSSTGKLSYQQHPLPSLENQLPSQETWLSATDNRESDCDVFNRGSTNIACSRIEGGDADGDTEDSDDTDDDDDVGKDVDGDCDDVDSYDVDEDGGDVDEDGGHVGKDGGHDNVDEDGGHGNVDGVGEAVDGFNGKSYHGGDSVDEEADCVDEDADGVDKIAHGVDKDGGVKKDVEDDEDVGGLDEDVGDPDDDDSSVFTYCSLRGRKTTAVPVSGSEMVTNRTQQIGTPFLTNGHLLTGDLFKVAPQPLSDPIETVACEKTMPLVAYKSLSLGHTRVSAASLSEDGRSGDGCRTGTHSGKSRPVVSPCQWYQVLQKHTHTDEQDLPHYSLTVEDEVHEEKNTSITVDDKRSSQGSCDTTTMGGHLSTTSGAVQRKVIGRPTASNQQSLCVLAELETKLHFRSSGSSPTDNNSTGEHGEIFDPMEVHVQTSNSTETCGGVFNTHVAAHIINVGRRCSEPAVGGGKAGKPMAEGRRAGSTEGRRAGSGESRRERLLSMEIKRERILSERRDGQQQYVARSMKDRTTLSASVYSAAAVGGIPLSHKVTQGEVGAPEANSVYYGKVYSTNNNNKVDEHSTAYEKDGLVRASSLLTASAAFPSSTAIVAGVEKGTCKLSRPSLHHSELPEPSAVHGESNPSSSPHLQQEGKVQYDTPRLTHSIFKETSV